MISKRDILKIESLLFLQAIFEAGSKREVAGQLGTSVDTLNKYLSEFEAEMKTKFLISNGRGTVITPEGKRMLDIAQDVVRLAMRCVPWTTMPKRPMPTAALSVWPCRTRLPTISACVRSESLSANIRFL